jgi:hypothetical protein
VRGTNSPVIKTGEKNRTTYQICWTVTVMSQGSTFDLLLKAGKD